MTAARQLCLKCLKPKVTCYCEAIQPFATDAHFVILQHPLERKRSVGTARLTHLCLKRSTLIPGAGFADDPQVQALLADPSRHCVVLYPGADALDIGHPDARAELAMRLAGSEESPGRSTADQKELVIFVIDGTWSCAATLMRRSPNLMALPKISFAPGPVSEYGFRKQPAPECLSTLEAVHRVIRLLEPEAEPQILLTLFRRLVADQLRYAKRDIVRLKERAPATH